MNKRYYLLRRNDKLPFFIECLFVFLSLLVFLVMGLTLINAGFFWIAMILFALMLAGACFYTIMYWCYYFYYNEKDEMIVVKMFRRKERRFPVNSIGAVYQKRNEDPYWGATNGGGKIQRLVYVIESKEGYDYLYFRADGAIFSFLSSHGIDIVHDYRE